MISRNSHRTAAKSAIAVGLLLHGAISLPASPAKETEFSYDAAGRVSRIAEKVNGVESSTRTYVWAGERLVEERDADGTKVTRRFLPQGEQIADGGGKLVNYFYSRDHLGSVRALVDSAGKVVARYDYDPYGRRTKAAGSSVEAAIGYAGYFHHAASGLNLTHYRAYDPALGRWLSRDPIGEQGGLNLYAYVENDPINSIDPLGLEQGWLADRQTEWHQGFWYTLNAALGRLANHLETMVYDPTALVTRHISKYQSLRFWFRMAGLPDPPRLGPGNHGNNPRCPASALAPNAPVGTPTRALHNWSGELMLAKLRGMAVGSAPGVAIDPDDWRVFNRLMGQLNNNVPGALTAEEAFAVRFPYSNMTYSEAVEYFIPRNKLSAAQRAARDAARGD